MLFGWVQATFQGSRLQGVHCNGCSILGESLSDVGYYLIRIVGFSSITGSKIRSVVYTCKVSFETLFHGQM